MFQTHLFRTFLLAAALAVFGVGLAHGQWPGRQEGSVGPTATPEQSVVAAAQTLIRDLEQTVTARRVRLTCKDPASLRECIKENLLEPPREGRLLGAGELFRLRGQLGTLNSYITNAAAPCLFEVGDAIELVRPGGRSLLVFSRFTCRQILFGRVDDSAFSVRRLDLSVDIDR